ncbi:MAG: hypothetical protein M5U14_21755 [Acidimicrobiia bacterium]|nr:hypothetical protein [Acidimicrobiia bacterium]
MHARVTQLEIDTLRVDVGSAVEVFEREVLPVLREQPGYRGVYVLATPEGKGVLLSLWETAEQAEAGGTRGFYPETLARYVTLFASSPGRERYEVMVVDGRGTGAG